MESHKNVELHFVVRLWCHVCITRVMGRISEVDILVEDWHSWNMHYFSSATSALLFQCHKCHTARLSPRLYFWLACNMPHTQTQSGCLPLLSVDMPPPPPPGVSKAHRTHWELVGRASHLQLAQIIGDSKNELRLIPLLPGRSILFYLWDYQ